MERANGYLETSFLPGRRFASPADFNDQLASWLPTANDRVHSTLRCRPSDRIDEDRAAMMALPPMLPDPAWGEIRRLGRDHWVSVDSCDYSLHPRAIGRKINLRLDLEELVVTCAGDVVARHARSWPATGPSPTPPRTPPGGRYRRRSDRPVTTTSSSPTCRSMTGPPGRPPGGIRPRRSGWPASAPPTPRAAAGRARLGRVPLLVIDEVGYIPFEAEANLFFQLVSSRYERASVIVTSNKAFGRWGEVFGDAAVAGHDRSPRAPRHRGQSGPSTRSPAARPRAESNPTSRRSRAPRCAGSPVH